MNLLFHLLAQNCTKRVFFAHAGTIDPRFFAGWALSPDSVSPRMNTIISCDLFKPIRIGENLVVNYNG